SPPRRSSRACAPTSSSTSSSPSSATFRAISTLSTSSTSTITVATRSKRVRRCRCRMRRGVIAIGFRIRRIMGLGVACLWLRRRVGLLGCRRRGMGRSMGRCRRRGFDGVGCVRG
ncbi:hypothetical protein Tdes44962_MAKER04749, partial [Teratosphaeria destructans]